MQRRPVWSTVELDDGVLVDRVLGCFTHQLVGKWRCVQVERQEADVARRADNQVRAPLQAGEVLSGWDHVKFEVAGADFNCSWTFSAVSPSVITILST